MSRTLNGISARLRLADMRVTRIDAECLSATYLLPLSIVCNEPPAITYARHRQGVVFTIAYRFRAQDANERDVWRVECTLLQSYCLSAEIADNELQQCGELVLRQAHDFMRELVDSLSQSMGLPRLVLDMFRPPTAVTPE